MAPPGAALFSGPGWRALAIAEADLPALQAFFEANPAYCEIIAGGPPAADEAREEWGARPPEDWPWTARHLLRIVDDAGAMTGVVDVVTDLLAPGVHHVGLFIVATARHGDGTARALLEALVAWARRDGARWLRLNVAEANPRAARFWAREGFVPVRTREGVAVGRLVHRMHTMVRPLDGGTLAEYLALVPRDRPEGA